MHNNTCTTSEPRKAAQGFSLIEVLIALVILSVGMLGVLTLQVKGLQFSQSARISTDAILGVSDMADRIRSNPSAGVSYDIDFGVTAKPDTLCADLPDEPLPLNAACTPAELAVFDIWLWKTALEQDSGIPEGKGSIEVALPDPDVVGATTTSYIISLNYTERGEDRSYQVVVNN